MDVREDMTIHQQNILQQIGVMVYKESVHRFISFGQAGADSPAFPCLPDNWDNFLKLYNHYMNIFICMA